MKLCVTFQDLFRWYSCSNGSYQSFVGLLFHILCIVVVIENEISRISDCFWSVNPQKILDSVQCLLVSFTSLAVWLNLDARVW